MSGCLLDTNVPSETLRPMPNARVASWLKSQGNDVQFLGVVTIGELRRGATLLEHGAKRLKFERFIEIEIPLWFGPRILPISQSIAERWGTLDAVAQMRGTPVNTADAMIAATALEHGLTVVTRNAKDFDRLGAPVLNPWQI